MRLNRLRQLTAAELRWRAGDAWRTAVERAAARVRPPAWDRRGLLTVLAPDVLDPGLRAAIEANRWSDVHAALAARIAARPSRYVLDPASAADLRGAILAEWPGAASDAAAHADRMLAGRYDLLGYRDLPFRDANARLDWHFDPVHDRRAPRAFYADVPYLDPAVGDHKVIWEFNRLQHWMRYGRAYWLTGNATYAAAVVSELESWLASNPPLVGINWASMLEAGFRSLSWVWSLHCLLREQGVGIRDQEDTEGAPRAWLVDLLMGLDRHLAHIERHLSYYFSPNTHLTGEALALYVAGTALPELAGSRRWIDTGRRILLTEIDRQIHADGGHVERSTHYQRYTLDFYLLAYLTARHSRDAEAEQAFGDAARRLAEFTRTVADDSGRLPLIGDDDGGMAWPLAGRACSDVRDSLALAAAVFDRADLAPWGTTEETLWIAGPDTPRHRGTEGKTRSSQPQRLGVSCLLAETGYFVARDGHGGHAVLDVGRHGYMNAGHAHADALALTLTIDGRPLLIDPGTSTYTTNPALRDRMRSSTSHNTVTLDGRSQSIPSGPFHWRTQSHARIHALDRARGLDWILASHDGYGPDGHVRGVLRTEEDGWLIVDGIGGAGHHTAALTWHFDPAWQVSRQTDQALRAVHQDGTVIWLLHDGQTTSLHEGDDESGLGWYAPVYGTLIRTCTARITRAGVAPFSVLTWIGPSETVPSLSRIEGRAGDAPVMTARVDHDGRSSTFVIRPGHTAEVRTGPAFAHLKDGELMCGVSD